MLFFNSHRWVYHLASLEELQAWEGKLTISEQKEERNHMQPGFREGFLSEMISELNVEEWVTKCRKLERAFLV